MNTTRSAGTPLKSASDTVRPSTLTSEKSGALVPRGNIVLGVRAILISVCHVSVSRPQSILAAYSCAASISACGLHGNRAVVDTSANTPIIQHLIHLSGGRKESKRMGVPEFDDNNFDSEVLQ